MTDAIVMTVESVRTRASTNEALVTFAVPLENAALVSGFMGKIGIQVGCAFADVEAQGRTLDTVRAKSRSVEQTDRYNRLYGDIASVLRRSGFCRAEKVWRALGTDEEFREWVQKQKSAWSGQQDWVDVLGEGRCEAAHVSRIEYGRGMSHKPEYACIPLTHAEHMNHHQYGESAFDDIRDDGTKDDLGRDWMERMRWKYVEQWAWDTLKATLGYESMADVPPSELKSWASKFDVEHLLPREYRDA